MSDKTERLDLIRHFLEDRSMPKDVVAYLADNITDNIRRLKAAVAQLLTMGDGTQNPMDIDMARAVVPASEYSPQSESQFQALSVNYASQEPQSPVKPQPTANRFKQMLASAESEEEQALALQIALGERIRELRNKGGEQESIRQLERALELLRRWKRGRGDQVHQYLTMEAAVTGCHGCASENRGLSLICLRTLT